MINQKNKFKDRKFKAEKKDDFESKLLDLARVTRVSSGGRHFRFRATMIVGNKKGKVGLGVAKGTDATKAIEKAGKAARKRLVDIPIIEDTIPHEIFIKLGPSKILLRPQKKGRGLVAGETVRAICDLAGIKNISSKTISRTSNKINNARATLKALSSLKISKEN